MAEPATASAAIDPHLTSDFVITRRTKVASAGSCFAQHISSALVANGNSYLVTEAPPPEFSGEEARRYGYSVSSARYGNIYSTLQLLQLVQRAYALFAPTDQFWRDQNGRWFDLLRPRIGLQGYASRAEAETDCRQHLAAVRRIVETTDVIVFTLGLTEVWLSTADGTAYPTCPGCGSAGEFDPLRYRFHNLSAAETAASLATAIELITAHNPSVQFVLTVSPVPLAATMEPQHVLQATTYSKSVLRVAAEEMRRKFCNVHYFASYEIVTEPRRAHTFFESDGRSISEVGIARVMDIFFRQFGQPVCGDHADPIASQAIGILPAMSGANSPTTIVCDEDEFYRALAASVNAP